ncbi:MAG: hypothetical protein CMM80_06230 [Rhodospirillaceae bacterium]|nr:hypothetical protein [Rhodospirillaceae bacterium]
MIAYLFDLFIINFKSRQSVMGQFEFKKITRQSTDFRRGWSEPPLSFGGGEDSCRDWADDQGC